MQSSEPEEYLGKRVRMSANVKSQEIRNWAGLWMRIDGQNETILGFDNMEKRPIKGTTDWTKYEIVLDVPQNTVRICFGILLAERGQVWVDEWKLEAVDSSVPTTNMTQGVVSHPEAPTDEQVKSAPAPKAVVDWLRGNAIRLNTVEAGHGFADMQPLKAVVGNARIVALGEATHGTREFFQLKHRMLEFLVSEMGFNVFAIEANLPEARAVNNFVLEGKGDPAAALAGLYFWTWNTEEVLDMIRWMRRYNQDPSHARKIKFYGFDMQTPTVAAQNVLAYLNRVDPEYAKTVEPILSRFDSSKVLGYSKQPQEILQSTAAGIAEALKRFDDKEQDYVRVSTTTDYHWARQNLRVVSQAEQQLRHEERGLMVRDRSMADNVKWILDTEGPGAKMVLWAHNGHVSAGGYSGGESMGVHLRRMYGGEMVIFGFAFDQGSFRAVEIPFRSGKGLRDFTVAPAPQGSLDATLAQVGVPLYAVDFRRVPPGGPVAEWIASPHLSRSVGAVYSDSTANNFFAPILVAKDFDAILFVENTHAAKANPSGPGSEKH
jgi:erythromycin esterase